MTARRFLHARTGLVVPLAALVVVTSTATFAAAQHDGDESVLHACVAKADGQLRLLQDATSSCRANETPVQWSTGSDSGQALADFVEALARADDDGRANDSDGLVQWSNLDSVPDSVLGAGEHLDELRTSLAAVGSGDLLHWSNLFGLPPTLADGAVGFDELTGQAAAGQLGVASVVGDTVKDGSLHASDLAGAYGDDPDGPGPLLALETVAGAVTSAKINDDSVESRDLRDGSVTADKLALPAARFTNVDFSSLGLLTGGSDAPTDATQALAVGGRAHRVMVTSQAQISCLCSNAGDAASVQYQLVRTSDPGSIHPTYHPVSPVYEAMVRNGQNTLPVSVSALDTVDAGDVVYRLRFVSAASGTAAPSADNVVVNAVVIGAA